MTNHKETQAIEHDIMYGRGAYLYKQVERELAFQREQAKILRQFEAMRPLFTSKFVQKSDIIFA